MASLKGVLDKINPLDDIGESLAKGAFAAGVAEFRKLAAEYPLLDAALKGKTVSVELRTGKTVLVELKITLKADDQQV